MLGAAVAVLSTLLALVLGVAGIAKLVDPAGTRQTLRAFGVPAPIDAPGAFLLPLAELLIAGALLLPVGKRWPATGGLLLLAVVSAGVMNSLVHGRRPDCNCFGRLGAAPVGWRTLARNGALAGAAVVLVAAPDERAGQTVAALQLAAFALLTGALVLAVGARASGYSLGPLEERLGERRVLGPSVRLATRASQLLGVREGGPPRGLPVGAPAPNLFVRGRDGRNINLASLVANGHPAVLVFSDPGCRPCVSMAPSLARWQAQHRPWLTIAVITAGEAAAAQQGPANNVLTQTDHEVSAAFDATVMPSAVLVTPEGTIGSPLAIGEPSIAALIESAEARRLDG
jgi:hypothetical protein